MNQLEQKKNELIQLEYSEKQGLFHFNTEPEKKAAADWIILSKIYLDDAILFTEYIEKQYKDNYPDAHTIKLLFLEFVLKLAYMHKWFIIQNATFFIIKNYINKKPL